jgi:hypothetical protein
MKKEKIPHPEFPLIGYSKNIKANIEQCIILEQPNLPNLKLGETK